MKNNELNANPVGAGFHTRPIKENSGITLIALIITIIVMLILVGVTVNVALTGGLFTKASEASKQMQVEAEKEELLSSVVAAIGYDGKVDLGEIELPTGWTGSNGLYTSPKGNTYTVDENGKIIGGEKDTKPALKQIKEGDVWKNVTFSSMKLSNTGVPSESFGFMLDDEEPFFEYQVHEDGSRMLLVMINENKYIYYIFYLGEDIGDSFEETFGFQAEFEKFYLKDDEMGIMKEMTEEEINNINFSGTLSVLSDDGYISIPSQMLTWFTGEVEYAE